jgi:hypothetical protein
MSTHREKIAIGKGGNLQLAHTGWGGYFLEVWEDGGKEELCSIEITQYANRDDREKAVAILETLTPEPVFFQLRIAQQQIEILEARIKELKAGVAERIGRMAETEGP